MTTSLRSPQSTNLSNATSPGQQAAIRGAISAFGKPPPVKPKPNLNTYNGSDSALAAARGAGRTRGSSVVSQHEQLRTPERQADGGGEWRVARQSTGGSVNYTSPRSGGERNGPERPHMGRFDSNGFLQPGNMNGSEGRSPSFIAATLAASRSASLSPNVTGQGQRASVGSGEGQRISRSPSRKKRSVEEEREEVDGSSIPPTNSLVGIFERNAGAQEKMEARPRTVQTGQVRRREVEEGQDIVGWRARTLSSPTPRQRSSPEARSPPPRAKTPPKQVITQPTPFLDGESIPQLKPKPVPRPKPGQRTDSMTTSTSVVAPMPIPPRKQHIQNMSNTLSPISAAERRPQPPPRRISPQKRPQQKSPSSSNLSLDSANFKINAMANAIVASSLASSRAASPAKQVTSQTAPPPPPSRRGQRNNKDHFFHHKDSSRTPSPAKQNGLRTTMRKPNREVEPDEGEKRRTKKHNIMKKHPNKHAEGDRKRWRDAITERERKRYEAVWASNKGLHVFPAFEGSESVVCNLVVKDIFARSRLHFDVLEEVYGLVDRRQQGWLEREEFVVGLWLIDQRLKGRKLPMRVSDHVWRSVGGLNGIKVKKAYKG